MLVRGPQLEPCFAVLIVHFLSVQWCPVCFLYPVKTGSPLEKKKKDRRKKIFNIVLKKLRLFSLGSMMKACKLELYSVAHKSHETRDLLRHIHPLRTQYFLKGRDNSCNNKQRPQTVTAHRLLNASLYLQKMFSVLEQFTNLMAQ